MVQACAPAVWHMQIEPLHVAEALVSIIIEDSEQHVGISDTQITEPELRERLMQIYCQTQEHVSPHYCSLSDI